MSGVKLTESVYAPASRTVVAFTTLAVPPWGVAVYAKVPETVVDPSVAVAFRTPARVVPYVIADGWAHVMVGVTGLTPVPLTAMLWVAALALRWLSVSTTN